MAPLNPSAPAWSPADGHTLTQPDRAMAAPNTQARGQNRVVSDSSDTTQATTSTAATSISDQAQDCQSPSSPKINADADAQEKESPSAASPLSPPGPWQDAGVNKNFQAILELHQITIPQWKTEAYRWMFNSELSSTQFPRVDTPEHFKRFYAAYPDIHSQMPSEKQEDEPYLPGIDFD